MNKIPIVLLLTLLFSICLFGKENYNQKANRPLYKPLATSDIRLNVNRMDGIFRNNGIWHFDVVKSDWGLEWPKGSGNSPIYAGGQYIAAKVNGEIRVAGVQHSATEYQPGMILSPGVADNPKDAKYQWYQLRSSGSDDRSRWPVDQGAPLDGDGNPQLLGDQTIYSVWNDLADHAEYGTNKLSVEVHQTAFAFNRADALGDMQFIKWLMVNKSGQDWEDTYFAIWLDPDLGGAADDQVGCDTTLGLGYTWNAVANDQSYGSTPPAQGIDFFQGPIIDEVGSEVVLPDGTVLVDKKMLKMTSFLFYNNTDNADGNPDSGKDVWNYLTGFWRDDRPVTFGDNGRTVGNPPTKFMFSGDPVTGEGWLDSAPDDRRFIMTTGPFSMPAWSDENGNGQPDFGEPGVQEIVAGVILAQGTDNLNSVAKLREVDILAQLAYDLNFNLSKAPLPPVVQQSEGANEVVLTWDETSEFNPEGGAYESTDPIVAAAYGDTVIIDNTVKEILDSTYNFYGYSVYQYSDPSGRDPVLIDHWDVGPIADATNYSAQRFSRITVNKNGVIGNAGDPLVNGKEYYFGVEAEAYLEFGAPVILTSPPTIVTVIPRIDPGTSYSSQYGDTLDVEHLRFNESIPLSDGQIVAWVVDPSKTTGDDYRVTFWNDSLGHAFWDLVNVSSGDTVVKGGTNQTGDDAYNVLDGLLIKVQGPDPGIKSVAQVDPADWSTELDNNVNFSLGHQFTPEDPRYFMEAQGNAGSAASNLPRWDWRGNMTPNDYIIEFVENPEANGQMAINFDGDVAKHPTNGGALMDGWTESDTIGGTPTIHTTQRLPFKVYRIDTEGNILQVTFCILDDDGDWTWSQTQPTAFTDVNNGFERIYVVDHPYDEVELMADLGNNVVENIVWGSLWDSGHTLGRVIFGSYTYNNGPYTGSLAGKPPVAGTVIRYTTNKPNLTNDYYTFSAPAAKSSTTSSIEADMDKIRVVPNPYYGYHSGELDPFDRWIQFTFLPPKCTIRVFDLAGNLVRKLEKNDEGTPLLQWDMKNEYEIPVASGIYVFHVDAPGVGEKIGKIAIFAPNERLDTY